MLKEIDKRNQRREMKSRSQRATGAQLNWLDKAIGWVSPEVGVKRAASRQTFSKLSGYEGARRGRYTGDWAAPKSSANFENRFALATLRDRARDLPRNNPYAAKALDVLPDYIIGNGIRPRIKDTDYAEKDKLEDLWEAFVEYADIDGQGDYYGMQWLAVRTMVESGESLIIPRLTARKKGRVPLQLQLLEPDFIDDTKHTETADGGYIVSGIEFDNENKLAAYHMFTRHPGEFRATVATKRVKPNEVIRLYRRLRPGQIRGITGFAPVMLKMKDLDDYDDAELLAKQVQSCFAAFRTRQEGNLPLRDGIEERADGVVSETIRPMRIEELAIGESIEFAAPPSSSGTSEYWNVQLHAVAAGLGCPYELLTGDLSRVNYSSGKLGMQGFHRGTRRLQKHTVVPQICRTVWSHFITAAIASGEIKAAPRRVEWTPPRWETVDPIRDTTGILLQVRAGLISLPDAIMQMGGDPKDTLAEIAAFNEHLDNYALVLDSDPRRVTRAGVGQFSDPLGLGEEENNAI